MAVAEYALPRTKLLNLVVRNNLPIRALIALLFA